MDQGDEDDGLAKQERAALRATARRMYDNFASVFPELWDPWPAKFPEPKPAPDVNQEPAPGRAVLAPSAQSDTDDGA